MQLEYFENTLCVEAGWLYGDGDIMTKANYDRLRRNGTLRLMRRGCKGTPALIAYDSIPERFQKIIELKIGDVYAATRHKHFVDLLEADAEATSFFSTYLLPDGRHLKPDTQKEYNTNAMFLNAVGVLVKNRRAQRRALGGQQNDVWTPIANVVAQLKDSYKHTLPGNPRRLYDRHRKYVKEGYPSLIHKNFCNDHSRKVNEQIESLIIALACMDNKPYFKGNHGSVHDMYLQFLGGAIQPVDVHTGEIYNAEDFRNNDGTPVVISDSTVWNYLSTPKNRVIISQFRNDKKYNEDTFAPHHHRHAPLYSFSKISMDDRDLPRKAMDGRRPKVYYAYDVASTCVTGASYSRDKDTSLFIDCMRDMFQFIETNELGQPLEVEVEHHLVNQFKHDLMKAGMLFNHVRWCVPGNSQEKRAEHFNRAKKYGYEKRYQAGIGRFHSKLEANRPIQEQEWKAGKDRKLKEKLFDFDELVADDRRTIEAYNNDLHPKQKLYPGKTRLQVLKENQNPNTAQVNKSLLYKYIGNATDTSIRRSQYLQVQGEKYALPSPDLIDFLEPNNYKVTAYWLPNGNGIIDQVYVYQGDLFIGECKKQETYNEAKAEQTERDIQIHAEQAEYVSAYREKVKEGKKKVSKVRLLEPTVEDNSPVEVFAPQTDNQPNYDFDNEADDNYDDFDYDADNAIDSF
uniref:hypothetical protein n=1 Tax=uncultured Draconibacterium sp. TaxID=1573823 RepID=UPI003216BDF6